MKITKQQRLLRQRLAIERRIGRKRTAREMLTGYGEPSTWFDPIMWVVYVLMLAIIVVSQVKG